MTRSFRARLGRRRATMVGRRGAERCSIPFRLALIDTLYARPLMRAGRRSLAKQAPRAGCDRATQGHRAPIAVAQVALGKISCRMSRGRATCVVRLEEQMSTRIVGKS